MLTIKEKMVLRFIISSFDKDYSINQIAKECSLAPNGARKILRKFEKQGVLKEKDIANIKSYKVNLESEKTSAILELAFMSEIEGNLKYRLEDLKGLKEIAKACILFGSYTEIGKQPNDLDALFILDKANYKGYKKILDAIRDTVPAKIHDVVQTEEDLKKNLIKRDAVILAILRKGIVLWGHKTIIGVVEDVYKA